MSERTISKEEIRELAVLANLEISKEEERLSEALSETLDYVKVLGELDTSGVGETFQITGLSNIFQDDSRSDSLSKEEALFNAHSEVNGLFSTKAVFNR
ncbi:MAG TPA: Asp-tRNA(Asn)/Glu-tRNA(Gln) amidotransferase subunit GatC [bacterium]|nr:Asp-tRNA(Asn)/Glu-tRNA(Gln) amidotransferase subunit GatC [bacterium]